MQFHQLAAVAALVSALPMAAQAVEVFGSTTFTLLPRSIAGAFPIAPDDGTARSCVLGSPDGKFLTLPGQAGMLSGAPFPGAYVEVGFGANFGPATTLNIYEAGNNAESTHAGLGLVGWMARRRRSA